MHINWTAPSLLILLIIKSSCLLSSSSSPSSSSSSSSSIIERTYKFQAAAATENLHAIIAENDTEQLKKFLLANEKISSANEIWTTAKTRLECAKSCSRTVFGGSVCVGFDYKSENSNDNSCSDSTASFSVSNCRFLVMVNKSRPVQELCLLPSSPLFTSGLPHSIGMAMVHIGKQGLSVLEDDDGVGTRVENSTTASGFCDYTTYVKIHQLNTELTSKKKTPDRHIFNITITTGGSTFIGAPTDANVTVTLGIDKYEYSQPIPTIISYEEVFPLYVPASLNVFEESDTDTFLVVAGSLGSTETFKPTYLRMEHDDTGIFPPWRPVQVIIVSMMTGVRWALGIKAYVSINANNCSLTRSIP
ncbi:hypothetical protein HELRODRAFT_176977 [Helobdella robusta]|uniref:IgGFc-binding protein N-terminal domain-containing protein n=1 Tax=Helobdella robusta TaxID=6412 RepID=T1FB32_HELRO|nr:hypothetical protein HELRODRAFT_176977 [Helobdella robusta]ESN98501.1 hypothetical protein HELRODRAFT_176977 [Helobdella robusta]